MAGLIARISAVGARVLAKAAEVWQQSELLLKVKEPLEPEYPLMHADLTMSAYFHLAPDRARAGDRASARGSSPPPRPPSGACRK
ncbi:MAG: hypothetical protein ABSG43_26275 [Solirubrobacteraceae bacterium]|jgi:alanine dehydrogenase